MLSRWPDRINPNHTGAAGGPRAGRPVHLPGPTKSPANRRQSAHRPTTVRRFQRSRQEKRRNRLPAALSKPHLSRLRPPALLPNRRQQRCTAPPEMRPSTCRLRRTRRGRTRSWRRVAELEKTGSMRAGARPAGTADALARAGRKLRNGRCGRWSPRARPRSPRRRRCAPARWPCRQMPTSLRPSWIW